MIENDNPATVHTLAAEVRVLVVGRRQITTGVARQLDVMEPSEIEPFGRISPRAVGLAPSSHVVHIVGRDKATGALVRAYAHKASEAEAHAAWSALPLIVLASR